MVDDVFARRVLEARKRAGLTQPKVKKLAENRGVGVSMASLSRYENGHQKPGVEIAQTLASIYGVTVAWLYGDEVGVSVARPAEQRQLARWLRGLAAWLEEATDEGGDVLSDLEASMGRIEATDLEDRDPEEARQKKA